METIKNRRIIKIISGALLIAGFFLYFSNNSKISKLELKTTIVNNEKDENLNQSENINEKVTSNQEKLQNFQKEITHEQKVILILDEIIKSQNDSDPRINSELKDLSPQIHQLLYEKYNSYSAEERNAKGFIVFLIARDLKSVDDIEFITKIYQEAPCLSLEDCKNVGSGDPHHSGTNQTTLVYPQFAGLYQIEKQLQNNPGFLSDSSIRQSIENLLKRAEDFPVPTIQDRAHQIRQKYGI